MRNIIAISMLFAVTSAKPDYYDVSTDCLAAFRTAEGKLTAGAKGVASWAKQTKDLKEQFAWYCNLNEYSNNSGVIGCDTGRKDQFYETQRRANANIAADGAHGDVNAAKSVSGMVLSVYNDYMACAKSTYTNVVANIDN